MASPSASLRSTSAVCPVLSLQPVRGPIVLLGRSTSTVARASLRGELRTQPLSLRPVLCKFCPLHHLHAPSTSLRSASPTGVLTVEHRVSGLLPAPSVRCGDSRRPACLLSPRTACYARRRTCCGHLGVGRETPRWVVQPSLNGRGPQAVSTWHAERTGGGLQADDSLIFVSGCPRSSCRAAAVLRPARRSRNFTLATRCPSRSRDNG